eukprot:10539348-Ditylum_brightwellii.AAC.2
MESLGATYIAHSFIGGNNDIYLGKIIIDNDVATMKAMQWKEDGGLLSNDSQVASKLDDLNHQTRGFGNDLYKLRDTKQK